MVLQKQEPQSRSEMKEGHRGAIHKHVIDGDSRAAGSLGLLCQARESFSALRSEWTGLIVCHNRPGWRTKAMKHGFKAHKA